MDKVGWLFPPMTLALASVLEHWCCFLPQVPPGTGWVSGPIGPVFSVPVLVAVVCGTFGYHHTQDPILATGQLGLGSGHLSLASLALCGKALHLLLFLSSCLLLAQKEQTSDVLIHPKTV